MKLKEFSPETITVTRGGYTPSVSIIVINVVGRISFNQLMCDKLNLKVGDPVKLWQDEKDPAVWYVSKTKNGFPLRKESTTKSLVIQSAAVAKEIVASVNASVKRIKAKVYPEPETVNKEKLYRLDFVPAI